MKIDFVFVGEFEVPLIGGWFVHGYEPDWTWFSNFALTMIFVFGVSFWNPLSAFLLGIMWHLGQEIANGIGAKWEIRKQFDPHGFDYGDLGFGILGAFAGMLIHGFI